ncbi:hypothetical protein CCHR01_18334 [Colletotrichum chrysophilum]|uniref:Uncharacterized protein n=1 Tax=Colletotrichum chrysophilum TaxID=1836956 RepID=A0AAD9A0J5_9PEZI|nr:hypothetical protein CCHR01_18334 [Colletotrichum chrysophilum]
MTMKKQNAISFWVNKDTIDGRPLVCSLSENTSLPPRRCADRGRH